MATFNNTNNLPAVNQYDANKSIISPLFLGQDYMQYFDVLPNIKGVTKVDHLGSLSKISKAFNEGAFSGSTGGTFSSVTLTPGRVEAELEFYSNTLFGKMKGQLMKDNFEFDNIEGTTVKNHLMDLIGQGIKADFNRQLFLGDSTQGSADYNIYSGVFRAAKVAGATQITEADIAAQGGGAALATGAGVQILKGLYDAADPAMLEMGNLVFFVSGDIADDYMATLEGTGYAAAGWGVLTNGVPALSWRGIPIVVRRDWDGVGADVAHIDGCSSAVETHRAVLTTKGGFIVGTDFDETRMEQWYSQDNKSYRFRVSYMCGVALADGKLAVCYTPDAWA